jgi:predicted AlkP superfamily phosphohydrolase/phosphomutase
MRVKSGFALALIIVLVLTIAIYLSASYFEEKRVAENMKYKKVLLIGLDGMDPKITSQLIAEGKLPNFEKLGKQGVYSNLSTSYPPHSPVSWTAIATGKNPGKTNIFDFIRRNVGSYMPELSLAKSKSGLAGTEYAPYIASDSFYKITSENKVPTTVIRWPVSFPPEKVSGKLLAGLGVPDVRGLLSGYAYYFSGKSEVKEDNKNMRVEINENIIETQLRGPKKSTSQGLVDITIPMQIKLNPEQKQALIIINNKEYLVKEGEWSEWISVEFKVGIFKKISSNFKIFLVDSQLGSFSMYLTTMQIDPKNPIVSISYPEDYSKELANVIGLYYTLGMPEETDGYVDGKIDAGGFLAQINEIENERTAMFWKEFETFKKQDFGVYAFVYDSSDRVQHVFWEQKLLDGSLEKSNGKIKINLAIEEYWAEKDKFLGQVLSQIDNNTLLLIISDHGFTSFEKAISVNTWLVKNEFMSKQGELSDENEDALFQGVDWAKTRAYSLGFNSIYLNLKGREPKGIIEIEDKEKIEDEIIAGLESLKDEKGNKVINKVYRASEIYSGDSIENAPDLVIGFNPGFRMAWQTAIGGFSKEIILKNTKVWAGDHLVDPKFVPGVLFSNQKLQINSELASQLDIAPTILDAFGINDSGLDFDGKSLLN